MGKQFTLTLHDLEGNELAMAGFLAPDEAAAVGYFISLIAPAAKAAGLVPGISEDGRLVFRPQFTGEVLN